MPTKPTPTQQSAVAEHRRRLSSHDLQRVQVRVRREDAPIVRAVAAALVDPDRAREARALLRRRFGSVATRNLKELLAAAPLEGVDLERSRDAGQPMTRRSRAPH